MPKMTSTSSSSSDRITDWAPVSCSGGTRLAAALALSAAGAPLACCGRSVAADGGRVVGALTISSLSQVLWTGGNKKPPPAQLLHEGCALVVGSSGNNQRAGGYYEHAVVHSG